METHCFDRRSLRPARHRANKRSALLTLTRPSSAPRSGEPKTFSLLRCSLAPPTTRAPLLPAALIALFHVRFHFATLAPARQSPPRPSCYCKTALLHPSVVWAVRRPRNVGAVPYPRVVASRARHRTRLDLAPPHVHRVEAPTVRVRLPRPSTAIS